MEESDEDDGGGDEEAVAVQQSFSAEQIECSGASAALTSDLTTSPPAGDLTPLDGPECSWNGGHEGEQLFGFIHQRTRSPSRDQYCYQGMVLVPMPCLGI